MEDKKNMDINIKKHSNEEFEEKEGKEDWDMPVSGEAGKVQGLEDRGQNFESEGPNISKFKDEMFKSSKVSRLHQDYGGQVD